MKKQFILPQSPFEVLFKDFFRLEEQFNAASNCKVSYPVDIYETQNGLTIDIAAVGLDKENIEITVEGNVLRIQYDKQSEIDETYNYIHKGISRKSFNLGWKIGAHFDMKQLEAVMDKGLLTLNIPYAEDAAPAKVNITIK